MNGPVGVEKLPLFEAARRAPPVYAQVRESLPPPQHRRADPDTSILAARNHLPAQRGECDRIEAYLRACPAGQAAWEIDAALGFGFEETARRLSDLERAGHTFRLQATRAGDGHGPCKVHVHVRFGAGYPLALRYVPKRRRAA